MKKYSKKFLSILIVLCLLTLTPFQVLAKKNSDEFSSDELISMIELDDTFIYSIELNGLDYSVQIEDNGLMVVSYMSEEQNVAYQSSIFSVDSFSEYNELNYDDIKSLILQVPENDYDAVITVKEQEENDYGISLLDADSGSDNGSITPISTVVNNTFGSSYTNRLIKTAVRSYDKDYSFGCYESQSNYKMKNQSISVAAHTTLQTIREWLLTGPFAIDVYWFVAACGSTVTTINGFKCIANALSADAYYYEISRTRNIKQPSVPSEVLYSTWWDRKVFFVYSQNGWECTMYSDYKHAEYTNFDSQFDNALTRLIYNFQ